VGSVHLSRPISELTQSMQSLADGALDTEVGYLGNKDEIGAMARTLQVFRDNARIVAQLSEDERVRARTAAERAVMMESFQAQFDHAVAASLEGDFSQRLDARFADADLARIAANFNGLL